VLENAAAEFAANRNYLNKYLRFIPIEFRAEGCGAASATIDARFSTRIKMDSRGSKKALRDSNSITKTGVKTIQSRFQL
jgi:hypothetical protein